MKDDKYRLWEYRSLKPVAFIVDDKLIVESSRSDFLWHQITEYYGVQLKCISCNAIFVFTALEQKTWYEKWGFSIHAYPVRCPNCRRNQRLIKEIKKKCDEILKIDKPTIVEFNEMMNVIAEMIGNQMPIGLKFKQKLLYYVNKSTRVNKHKIREALLKGSQLRI